jgi:hypothetical protein
MAERLTTVEIFHDEVDGRLPLDPVYQGVQATNDIVGNLQIIRDSELVSVVDGYGFDSCIAVDYVQWPRFSADLNIIVTNRRLLCEQEASLFDYLQSGARKVGILAVGIAYTHPEVGRIAIVKMDELGDRAATTSHEIGHLYNLKNQGGKHDNDHELHCRDKKCTMYYEQRDDRSRYRRGEFVGTQHFCNECAEQLAQNAFHLDSIGYI